MIKAATIAGSDASGGAGLEADLKTFEEYGVYGMVAVTTIATMDPDADWGHGVYALPEAEIERQMKTVFKGVGVQAAKCGMLGTDYAVELTRKYVTDYKVPFVLDPVMVCKGSNEPLNPELNAAIREKLVPICQIATPNLFEASQLAGVGEIKTLDAMKEAAKIIFDKGAKTVFVKGGAKLADYTGEKDKSLDIFYDGKDYTLIEAPLIHSTWNHGAGCTTAAAVTAGLARGLSPLEAVRLAKKFITASLSQGWPLNKWVGPGNPTAWRKAYN
jgi:pyridoxine kinase